MPLPEGYGRVTFVFSGTNVPTGAVSTMECLLHETKPPIEQVEDIAAAVGGAHAAVSTSLVTLSQVELKLGPEATGPTYVAAGPGAGGQGADASPPATALLIRKSLDGLSSRFAGRFYWPGLSDAAIEPDGTINSAQRATMQTAWNSFYFALLALNNQPVVIGATNAASLVSSFDIQPRVATQRRRNRR